jgi:hypothetical protein
MTGGALFLALAMAAQTHAPSADNVRLTASAGVTIIAGEDVRFAEAPQDKSKKRQTNPQRRRDKDRVLIEFF